MSTLPIALTMGDPAGAGGDITLKTWLKRDADTAPFFIIDDVEHLKVLAARLKLDVPIHAIDSPADATGIFSTALPVLHRPLAVTAIPGQPDAANAQATIGSIETAVALVKDGQASAVVTNPIAKDVLYGAGFSFPGHTEFLAHLSGPDTKPVMMLACDQLRVVLATVHVSVMDADRKSVV